MEFSTFSQVEYFALVGRMIALNNQGKVPIVKHTQSNILGVVVNEYYDLADSIRSVTEKWWRISKLTTSHIRLVFAIKNCVIVGVFAVDTSKDDQGFRECQCPGYDYGRLQIALKLADIEDQSKYLGREVDSSLINGPIVYL